jgi:hypothetical protein
MTRGAPIGERAADVVHKAARHLLTLRDRLHRRLRLLNLKAMRMQDATR